MRVIQEMRYDRILLPALKRVMKKEAERSR